MKATNDDEPKKEQKTNSVWNPRNVMRAEPAFSVRMVIGAVRKSARLHLCLTGFLHFVATLGGR